jgi:hypothetical protein
MVNGFMKCKPIINVGQTSNLAVDYYRKEKCVLIYGKEIPKECSFKLVFNESETAAIIDLLAKAKAFFHER